MWCVAGVCTLVVLSAVAGLNRNRAKTECKSFESLEPVVSSVIAEFSPKKLLAMSPTQINVLLARLDAEEAPGITMGAMCYDIASPPELAEYTCPVCGEKTLYDISQSSFITRELEGCRRMAESINEYTDFEITLDEGLFCDFCSADAEGENPTLILRVIHANGFQVLNEVSVTDLRMLDSFLQGNLSYWTDTEARYPLKEYTVRMRDLLGVKAD